MWLQIITVITAQFGSHSHSRRWGRFQFYFWKWLQNHPWIFFQNLLHHTDSHDAVWIKWSVCHSISGMVSQYSIGNSVVDVFKVCCVNTSFQFTSHLGTLRFHSSDWLHISIHGARFFNFFQNLPNFWFRG